MPANSGRPIKPPSGVVTLQDYIDSKTQLPTLPLDQPISIQTTQPRIQPNDIGGAGLDLNSLNIPNAPQKGKSPKIDPLSGMSDIIRRIQSGRSASEEAIVASLDPSLMGLRSDFANNGATGAGALNSMLLNQANKVGSQVAVNRQNELKDLFGMMQDYQNTENTSHSNLLGLLNNPNITPEEAGLITSRMLGNEGFDIASIPKTTERERFMKTLTGRLGATQKDGKWIDTSGKDVTETVNKAVDNWALSSSGLDATGKPLTEVGAPESRATWEADPFGEKTLQAANTGNVTAKNVVVDEMFATGDFSALQNMNTSDPVYVAVSKKIPTVNTGRGETSNRWNDVYYFTAYGSEDGDGNVTYNVGTRFKKDGKMYEITGQGEDTAGNGAIYMVVKDLVTGETKILNPMTNDTADIDTTA